MGISPSTPMIKAINKKDSKTLKAGICPVCISISVSTMPLLMTARSEIKNPIFLHLKR
jgi:hypothetical protein